MEKKILFFDFDGTLFSHVTNTVPQSAKQALILLKKQGHLPIIATGRGPESIEFISEQTGFDFPYMILLNGQAVYEKHACIYEHYIEGPSSSSLIQHARNHNFAYGGYCSIGEVLSEANSRVTTVWEEFGYPHPPVSPFFEQHYPVYQIHLYITEAEEELFDFSGYIINRPHRYLLALIPQSAGKSIGIEFLREKLGFALEDTFAFGDGANDKDMLEHVHTAIAMQSGEAVIFPVANYITASPDEDGIAKALEFYGFL